MYTLTSIPSFVIFVLYGFGLGFTCTIFGALFKYLRKGLEGNSEVNWDV